MKTIIADVNQVALCGLYCGSCKNYLKGSCPGCEKTEKANWCKIRLCCLEKKIKSCADCKEFTNVKECKKYYNFISKAFGTVFRLDRPACIEMIKDKGYEEFVSHMAANKLVCLKK